MHSVDLPVQHILLISEPLPQLALRAPRQMDTGGFGDPLTPRLTPGGSRGSGPEQGEVGANFGHLGNSKWEEKPYEI